MNPLLIEVRCNLTPNAPQWDFIDSLKIEVGYPGIQGKTIWKNIGWLQEKSGPIGRSFAHALWKPAIANQIMIFDFIPVSGDKAYNPLKHYRIKQLLTMKDGLQKTFRTGPLQGEFANEYFTLQPQYPDAKNP